MNNDDSLKFQAEAVVLSLLLACLYGIARIQTTRTFDEFDGLSLESTEVPALAGCGAA